MPKNKFNIILDSVHPKIRILFKIRQLLGNHGSESKPVEECI